MRADRSEPARSSDNRCPWCNRWFVVASLAADHVERCEVRPA